MCIVLLPVAAGIMGAKVRDGADQFRAAEAVRSRGFHARVPIASILPSIRFRYEPPEPAKYKPVVRTIERDGFRLKLESIPPLSDEEYKKRVRYKIRWGWYIVPVEESAEYSGPFYLAENPIIEVGKAFGWYIRMHSEIFLGQIQLYGAHILGMDVDKLPIAKTPSQRRAEQLEAARRERLVKLAGTREGRPSRYRGGREGILGWWDDMGGWPALEGQLHSKFSQLNSKFSQMRSGGEGGGGGREAGRVDIGGGERGGAQGGAGKGAGRLAFVFGMPVLNLRGGQGGMGERGGREGRVLPLAAREGKWPFFLADRRPPADFRFDRIE